MSRFSNLFLFTLALGMFSIGFPDADATPTVSAHLVSMSQGSGQTVHVTLRTQEGLERFVFTPGESATTNTEETHLAGFARPRNFQREKLPAAMTITDRRAWIFFTSRRTGRPAAAIITLSRADTTLLAQRVRVSRVPERTLECGSHSSEHAEDASTQTASRKRRINRPALSPVHAMRAGIFSPARVLEVATEADFEFIEVHGSETNSYIRAVLNAVNTIYTSSLGLKIKVAGQRLSSSNPGSRGTIDALDLLEEFRQGAFASNSPADVRHLFTGRSIEGLTIGIAYVASTCAYGGRYGVGLSRNVSVGLQPFLAAHEIAHNLSASHDSAANSIMNPAITVANNQFSARALNSIRDFVTTTGSCIGTEALSSARITLKGTDPTKFDARVKFTTAGTSKCSVALYGSGDGRRYTPLASRTKARGARNSRRIVSFIAKAPLMSTSQSFYFKAKVVCGRSRTISPSARLRYGLATSRTSGGRDSSRWLKQLRLNLR